jgi:tetratricopeptide (TPR) repeat protein
VTPPSIPRWRHSLAALAIIAAGMLAYANSLSGPFLIDDAVTVVDNPHVRQLWPLSQALFSEEETPAAGRPLVNLSFAINYAIGGLAVRGYHLVNIAIHILGALLLFGVVRRTLDSPPLHPRFSATSTAVALAVAILWMLHPLNTEAVDYLTQRTELMMGLFFFLTLYANSRTDDSPRRPWWRAIAVGACAAGMACKETMVTAPLLIVLYDVTFRGESIRTAFRKRGGFYAALAATWGLLVALAWSGPRARSAGWSVGISVWTNLLNQSVMIVRYLRLTVWPTALVLTYGFTHTVRLVDVLPSALLVVALLGVTLVLLRLAPRVGFLGAWFFVTLAPTSSVVPMITEVGAERRMYLPLAAPVALAVLGLHWLTRRLNRDPGLASPSGPSATIAIVVVAVVATGYTVETRARNREYRSGLVMAQTVLERWPTGYAHLLLATELIAVGDHQAALPHLRVAVQDTPRAEYGLGVELVRQQRWQEALEHLQAFVRLEPLLIEAVNARNLIGRIFLDRGRLDDAADQFQIVLRMDPSFSAAHGGLGDVRVVQRQWPAAIAEYQQYLPAHDDDANAWLSLGVALENTGRNDEAIAAFRHALAVDPTNAIAARDAAIERFSENDYAGTISYARQAVAARPNDALAHDLVGAGLASQSHFREAVVEFRRAVSLDPSNQDFQQHLSDAERSLGQRRP